MSDDELKTYNHLLEKRKNYFSQNLSKISPFDIILFRFRSDKNDKNDKYFYKLM